MNSKHSSQVVAGYRVDDILVLLSTDTIVNVQDGVAGFVVIHPGETVVESPDINYPSSQSEAPANQDKSVSFNPSWGEPFRLNNGILHLQWIAKVGRVSSEEKSTQAHLPG